MKLAFLLLDSQFPPTFKSSDLHPNAARFLQERQDPHEQVCPLDWERRKFWCVWLPERGFSPPGCGLSPPIPTPPGLWSSLVCSCWLTAVLSLYFLTPVTDGTVTPLIPQSTQAQCCSVRQIFRKASGFEVQDRKESRFSHHCLQSLSVKPAQDVSFLCVHLLSSLCIFSTDHISHHLHPLNSQVTTTIFT